MEHVVTDGTTADKLPDPARSQDALRFLVDASKVLTVSLDYRSTIQQIAALAVPFLADWCTVDILERDVAHCLAAAHVEPDRESLLWQLRRRYPLTPDGPAPGSQVLRAGDAILFSSFDPESLAATTRDAEHLRLVSALEPVSAMAVPLNVHGETIGVMTLTSTRPDHHFDETDVWLAQELAARAAVAVDHARLYLDAQQAIAERDAALDAARDERIRLLHVFMQVPALICVLRGREHQFEFANHLFGELFPGRDLLGRRVRDALPELEDQGIFELLDQAYRSGQAVHGNEWPFLLDSPAGTDFEEHFFNFVFQPFRNRADQVAGILLHAADVTEQVRARQRIETLAQENAALYAGSQRALQLRTEFLSIAAHELKTPLTTIKGYLDLMYRTLQRPTPDLPRIERHLTQLRGQVRRFEELVGDLLDISRIQQGRVDLRLEPVDLVDLTREVLQRYEGTASHSLVLDSPAVVEGRWDPLRLDQILTNLVSNAVKFSPDGSEVRVEIRQRGGTVEVTVRDQGPGTTPEERSSLFQPFFRGQAGTWVGGTGLGLYITRSLVEQHGGTIDVESEPGSGSAFTVRLPLHARIEPRDRYDSQAPDLRDNPPGR